MSVRRSHTRRTTAPSTKRTFSLSEMQRQVVTPADRCQALYFYDVDGRPCMSLMADGCPKCREFKAAIPPPPPPMPPTTTTVTDTDLYDEEAK